MRKHIGLMRHYNKLYGFHKYNWEHIGNKTLTISLSKIFKSKTSSSTNYYCRKKMMLNHLMDDFSSIKTLEKKKKKTGPPENLEKRFIK
jgi:hypothetical protein